MDQNFEGVKVMVIDDSKTIRRTAEILLSKEGCEVITAIDGFDALAKVADSRPAIIFVDTMMPRLDGYQTCALIKSNVNFQKTPVIMLSNKDGLFDLAKGRIAGSDQHLTKPFSKDELLLYLRRLFREQEGSEKNYLPMVNNLRAMRGDKRAQGLGGEQEKSAGPELSFLKLAASDEVVNAYVQGRGEANLPKIRARYQHSLGAILKKNQVRKNLTTIGKLFTMLTRLFGDSPTGSLVELGLGVVEGVATGGVKLDKQTATRLRQIDDHLKLLAKAGQQGLSTPVDEELAVGLIKLISESRKETKRISALRQRYTGQAQEQEDAAIGPGDETISTVASLLIKEFNSVGDKLDLFIRSQNRKTGDLASLLPTLEQIASVMNVLDYRESQVAVASQITIIKDLETSGEPSEDILLNMAQTLLKIAVGLDQRVVGSKEKGKGNFFGNLDESHASVIRETRIGLAVGKESVIGFISSEFDHVKIVGLPQSLNALGDGLMIANQIQAADVLKAAANYVANSLINGGHRPELEELDELADAITSVDYYLEKFLDNPSDPYFQMLDVAETAVEKLGYAVPAETPSEAFAEGTKPSVVPETAESEPEALEESFELEEIVITAKVGSLERIGAGSPGWIEILTNEAKEKRDAIALNPVKVEIIPESAHEPALEADWVEALYTATDDSSPVPAKPEIGDASKGKSLASANQRMVKVSDDLLEDLISLARESSIARSRVEQQITDLGESLQEIEETINQIRGQARRLEVEAKSTKTLVHFRPGAKGDSGVDDLAMDRYTKVQTISRALSKGASDMINLKDSLGNRIRDAETILHQQVLISAGLQEGLSRIRLVPFSRLIPRLRRVVRQVSGEVGKSVRFDADDVEGELDRNVFERIVAPLEHMLRNAVDHGIEDKETRIASGKQVQGRISLRLSREGGFVVLTFSDDGGGIDVNAVRAKAIERGLITEGQDVSDREVMQFIIRAGFSTAQKLTQISGRGVGMDVVGDEIKALGGNFAIDSTLGVGTKFTMRIPFAVAINRALIVAVKEETYAIPLNTIEGIVRVSPYELEGYYQRDAPMFEYAGQPYKLVYIGKMLNKMDDPNLTGQVVPLPVILSRSGDHAVALQVDRIIDSREVVVKTFGAQFGDVGGISAARELGDGNVVIILDCMELLRSYEANVDLPTVPFIAEAVVGPVPIKKVQTVMIVDESITERKATSELMEKQGFAVVMAENCVDAMNRLQSFRPDVVLLDIKTPRIDEFEILRSMQRDENLKGLPIIMITFKAGKKHKQQAMMLGVNKYLGKPFQEEKLLAAIGEVIESSKAKREWD